MTQKEKLVELIEDSINKWDFYLYHFDDERLYDDESEEKKKTFEEFISGYLLENGVIVPPCKVGDKMYCDGKYFASQYTGEIMEFPVNIVETTVISTFRGEIDVQFDFDDFGENVFLTKEEAEKALAEKRADNG